MDNGLIAQIVEQCLVDAMSFTEAEARITAEIGEGMREVEMMAIAKSPIKEVVMYGDTDLFFKCKVCYVLTDEDTEKEKKITTYLLVNANDAREAYDRCEEHLKEMLVPFTIPKIEESPIIDVYQYQKSAPAGFKKVIDDLKASGATIEIGRTKSDALIESKIGAAKELTAKLIERRDEVKRLFGDNYAQKVAEWKPIIQAGMDKHGHDTPLKAVLSMANEPHVDEVTGSLMIAVAVEMMERKPIDPTQGQAHGFEMEDNDDGYNEARRLILSRTDAQKTALYNFAVYKTDDMSELEACAATGLDESQLIECADYINKEADGTLGEDDEDDWNEEGDIHDSHEEECAMEAASIESSPSEALYTSLTSQQRRRLLQIHTDNPGSGPQQISMEFDWPLGKSHDMMDYLDGLAAIDESFLDDEEDGETSLEGRLEAALERADAKK
jgi:hypothetical protein